MTQPIPDPLRNRYAAALTAAANQCNGDCGLSEVACYGAHPITWSGMAGGTTHVDGSVVAIADTVMAARDQEMEQLRADLVAAHSTIARVQAWADSTPVTGRNEFGNGYREALRDIRDLLAQQPTEATP